MHQILLYVLCNDDKELSLDFFLNLIIFTYKFKIKCTSKMISNIITGVNPSIVLGICGSCTQDKLPFMVYMCCCYIWAQ